MNYVALWLVTGTLVFASAWPIMKTVAASGKIDRKLQARSMDGAYRDGLYLGRLDALAGRQPRAAVARWSQDADRDLFRAGYDVGYSQAIDMVR